MLSIGTNLANLSARYSESSAFQAPRSTQQHTLRDTVASVLDIDLDTLSTSESFHSLGGDSLSAMALRNRCRQLGLYVGYQDIIAAKSLIVIADTAEAERIPDSDTLAEKPFESVLSATQVFFLEKIGLSTRFHSSVFLSLKRSISSHMVRSVIGAIVKRHAMLRVRLTRGDTDWSQRTVKYSSDS